MKIKSIFRSKSVFYLVILITVFLYLGIVVKPELIYFAQQPAFQLSRYFFFSYLTYPGGLNQYVSLFISQYFFYNWIGALIITLTLYLFLFLGTRIIKNYTSSENIKLLIFFPVMILLSLFGNYLFSFFTVMNVLVIYASLSLSILFFKTQKTRWYFYFLIAPLTYYLAGSMSFLVFSLSYLFLLLHFIGLKKSILPILSILLTAIILPFIAYKYIFDIDLSRSYFQYYIVDNVFIKDYSLNFIYYCFYFSAPALLLGLMFFVRKSHVNKKIVKSKFSKKGKAQNKSIQKNTSYGQYVWYALIVIFACILIYKNTPSHEKNIIEAEFYCSNEAWEKAIETINSDEEYDVLYNFFYNRAIDHMGFYAEKYFEYPQLIGGLGTFPNKVNSERLYNYYSDYYFDLGYISQAQQWSFKTLSAFPYSPIVIKRLVITHLILGEYEIAEKFLTILDDNLLSSAFVEKYSPYVSDTLLVAKDKMIMDKRSVMPTGLITIGRVEDSYADLISKNKTNKCAYEHMQMNFILNHQFGKFYTHLPMASEFYTELPRVFEEALLIMKVKDPKQFANHKINPKIVKSFLGFANIFGKYKGDMDLAKSKLGDYKNTLFYYLKFDSPKVTKLVPVETTQDDYSH